MTYSRLEVTWKYKEKKVPVLYVLHNICDFFFFDALGLDEALFKVVDDIFVINVIYLIICESIGLFYQWRSQLTFDHK